MLPSVNYDKLRRLNSLGVPGNESDRFLQKFSVIFDKPPRRRPGIPTKTTKSFEISHPNLGRPRSRISGYNGRSLTEAYKPSSIYEDRTAHDIRLHLAGSRKVPDDASQAEGEDLMLHRENSLELLRTTLKKLPFERTRREHKAVGKLLRELWPTELNGVLDRAKESSLFDELAKVATLCRVPEKGLTVFGNSGLHMILRGALSPQTLPYLRIAHQDDGREEFACPTPMLRRNQIRLRVGDWFGTLVKVEGREVNTKVLSLIALERSQLLKISTSDFKRVLDKIQMRLQNEKMNVVRACCFYKNWPGLSVRTLAALVDWKTFPADSVIVEEGEIAPFVAFVRRGECSVFKQVEAMKTLPNGRRVRLFRNVLMDTLGVGDSLGENSILERKPMACTVVSRTELELGVIYPQRLEELDVTTRTLLSQSTTPKFSEIAEDDVQARFVKQEMEGDWQRLKHKILLNTLNHCGIRPGCGKWAHGKPGTL